jgi:hypothetical protein
MNDLALGLRGVQLGKGVQALFSPGDIKVIGFEHVHPKDTIVFCSRRIRKPSWERAAQRISGRTKENERARFRSNSLSSRTWPIGVTGTGGFPHQLIDHTIIIN